MKVLLLQDYAKLGSAGQVVAVKDGYARNFLIPAGFASAADARNIKALEVRKRAAETRAIREVKTHKSLAARLAQLDLVARVQVGEEDRMFGAVTASDIAELIARQGVEVDRRIIALDEPIKALGVYSVPVKLHADVEAHIKVRVVKQEE
jgi:large subunit ribosomal protein L9